MGAFVGTVLTLISSFRWLFRENGLSGMHQPCNQPFLNFKDRLLLMVIAMQLNRDGSRSSFVSNNIIFSIAILLD